MTEILTVIPTTLLPFPIATKAEYAIALSKWTGEKIREKWGKTSILEIGPDALKAHFTDEEECIEALRLYDLVQWIKKVGPYAKESEG